MLINVLDNLILKLNQVQKAVDDIPSKMLPFVEDLKKSEMRLGIAPDSFMPTYRSKDYLAFKKSLSTYKADAGRWDLFVSGRLHKGIKAVDEKGIIKVGNSSSSPDYADDFKSQTEGLSDKGAEGIEEKAAKKLLNEIGDIINA